MKVLSVFLIFLSIQNFCIAYFVVNETKVEAREKSNGYVSPTEWTDPYDDGGWFKLLEDYTTGRSNRDGRVMQYGSQRYIPTSGLYITKRIGEAMELEPHRRHPGKVIQHPNMNENFPMRQNFVPSPQLRQVSETDLYLLGAIEKLVYRVDYMENRLRRTEQLVYYLMAGNNQKEVIDPCPKNFTRVGENCYHISGERQVNWKAANGICKSMNSNLAEFESISENEDMVAYLLNHPGFRGKDFWLGGLNPGLLWIWSNSAKPVNPNTNLTSIAANNGPEPSSTTSTPESDSSDNKILNNLTEIKGSGRCLRLSYNPAKHIYIYYGQECTTRHHFLCEMQDKSLDNQIRKLAKELNFD